MGSTQSSHSKNDSTDNSKLRRRDSAVGEVPEYTYTPTDPSYYEYGGSHGGSGNCCAGGGGGGGGGDGGG